MNGRNAGIRHAGIILSILFYSMASAVLAVLVHPLLGLMVGTAGLALTLWHAHREANPS